MAAYIIEAIGRGGHVVIAASAQTARECLSKYRAAERLYPRVWVTDDVGDVSEDELEQRSIAEERNA